MRGRRARGQRALFAYWLYKIVRFRRNPITGVLYCELAA